MILIIKILFYVKKDRLYSCCLIQKSLNITGYITINQNSFEFINFKRFLNDKEKYYYDKEKNIDCRGILKYDKIYYLKINLNNIKAIYKRNYCYKDDSLELFVRQNKSHYFEFNNLEDNNFNYLNYIEIE